MNKMLGDEFKPFSNRAGNHRREWKHLADGQFNSNREILEEEGLPDLKKRNREPGQKYVSQPPKGAFQHDRSFYPGGVKEGGPGHRNQLSDFIGKFPEYVCSAPEEKKRRVYPETDRLDWKVT